MGVRFLALGLCSLGILDSHSLDPSNAMLLGLMDMYSEMGDRIALQYGGSEAHKKVSKGAGKTKHGEFLTSIKRYYSNSFTDRVKQDAMNLFLGYFQPSVHDFNLWDIETDYFLHNRSLHPPRPDVDRVLLSFSLPKSPQQQLLTDASDSTTSLQQISYPNLTEDEWNKILKKYYIRSSTITPEILQKILKKEQIKKRLESKQEEVLEAEELWWKQALFDFDTSTSWMRLPPLKDNRILSYYDTIHCPDRLTSFDYELSQEFQYPYDATVFASSLEKIETNSTIWNRNSKKRNLQVPHHEDEMGAVEGNEGDEEKVEDIQRDQVQFDLFSLARSLGSKAKNFVGELLSSGDVNPQIIRQPIKVESTDDLLQVDYSSPYYTRKLNTPYYSRKFSDSHVKATYSTKPLTNYDQIALRKYSRYYEDGIHSEVYITENYSPSKRDFLVALESVSVDVNDVKEMERLSLESYLHDTVASGISPPIPLLISYSGSYRGMQKSDSAKMVTSLIQSSLVFIESALETCILIGEDSKEEDVFCAIDSKSRQASSTPASASLLSSKKVKSIGTVDIPTSVKIQIENILQGRGVDDCMSLEEDILNCANKYLYDQLIYSRETDDDRLSTRLSSLTSELDILNYMSLYSNDLIALDMDSISFMLTDRSSTKPLHHLYNELLPIQTLHETMNNFKQDVLQSFYENSINVTDAAPLVNTTLNETDLNWNDNLDPLSYVTPSGVGHLSASTSSHEDYPGFLQTGPNVYAKISNPHFVCNEKTVSSYVSYKKVE